ncbi:MAG TPA: SgcJ/EcaC family oxidoreductase [Thermobifida alba]|nr:SgcJ/EcaC family oxidoreductase [Thermobifida alba]
MEPRETARTPEDLTRLFVQRANARDAEGIAALYEPDAVMAYPPGQVTKGRDAIRKLWEELFSSEDDIGEFRPEKSLPTLISGDLALTATAPLDDAGARAQVARRQPEGHWLRVLDQPEFRQ